MKIKKYRLQTEMENLKAGSEKWFKDYLKELLESDKPYYEKADYIAYCVNQIQAKIDYVSSEIKNLQEVKKSLSSSKELTMEVTASVLAEYGIDKIEGVNISSITINPSTTKSKDVISFKDENKIMGLGYVKFLVDEEAVEKALKNNESQELKELVDIVTIKETSPSKIKINNKRNQSNNEVKIEKQVA